MKRHSWKPSLLAPATSVCPCGTHRTILRGNLLHQDVPKTVLAEMAERWPNADLERAFVRGLTLYQPEGLDWTLTCPPCGRTT